MVKGYEEIPPQDKVIHSSQKLRKLEAIYKTDKLIIFKESLSLTTRGSEKVP